MGVLRLLFRFREELLFQDFFDGGIDVLNAGAGPRIRG
jgi:hypothetical protein